jgi:hypothetical protein
MKRRAASLIKSPLDWHMAAAPVPHPLIPVLAERGGTQLRTPRCTVVVDTREQNPLDFSRFEGWFAGIETRVLKLGDYSIAGLEDRCVVERKDLPDLTCSFTAERPMFVHRLRLLSQYPIAILAGLQIPFLCTESHELGEEMVASYLYQVHLYHWLETNGYGRFLADNDL